MKYIAGQTAVITATYTTPAGALADPSTVVFKLRDSLGVETSYTYGSSGYVARLSLGVYTLSYPLTGACAIGTWEVRAIGTGTVADATEQIFVVAASAFSNP